MYSGLKSRGWYLKLALFYLLLLGQYCSQCATFCGQYIYSSQTEFGYLVFGFTGYLPYTSWKISLRVWGINIGIIVGRLLLLCLKNTVIWYFLLMEISELCVFTRKTAGGHHLWLVQYFRSSIVQIEAKNGNKNPLRKYI